MLYVLQTMPIEIPTDFIYYLPNTHRQTSPNFWSVLYKHTSWKRHKDINDDDAVCTEMIEPENKITDVLNMVTVLFMTV
jgi:hypothetical protein